MTTGNSAVDYISMRPDADTRSIVELIELEKAEGYGGMADTEIKNLMDYRARVATEAEQVKIMQRESEEKMRMLEAALERQQQALNEMNARWRENRPKFETVEDDGSEK